MKNTKKLLIATIMLVFAFVAAVSSTFAWFTMQQEAEVSNLELQAAAAGTDLQVSLTGEDGSYGYTVSLATTGAKLVPVNYDKSDNKFYQLEIDTADANNNKGKYMYKEATPIAPGTAEGADNEGYLVYDLYFKTSSIDEVNLMLDMASIFVADGDDNILGTLRLMFVPVNGETLDYTNAIIYEHNYDENSTFGTGDYFVAANKYIAYKAFTHTDYPFLNAIDDGKYTLNDDFFATRKYTTNEAYDDSDKTLALGKIDNKKAVHYSVRIWLEGWDGDTTSEAATQKFVTYMRFFTTK